MPGCCKLGFVLKFSALIFDLAGNDEGGGGVASAKDLLGESDRQFGFWDAVLLEPFEVLLFDLCVRNGRSHCNCCKFVLSNE